MNIMVNPAADAPRLSVALQHHLGQVLASAYQSIEPAHSECVNDVLERLSKILEARDAAELEFRAEFLKMATSLRNFAMSLCRNPDIADDLVQDTMMRAWRHRSGFTIGTNLGAWLFTIMRNTYYSRHRQLSNEVQDSDGQYAATLATLPEQPGSVDLQDARAALMQLKPAMREALILVALENISYEEAAAVMNCSIGTVKSRVWRARDELASRLGYKRDSIDADGAMLSALGPTNL